MFDAETQLETQIEVRQTTLDFVYILDRMVSDRYRTSFQKFTSDSAKHRRVPGHNSEIHVLAQAGDKRLAKYFLKYFKEKIKDPSERRGVVSNLTSNKNLARVADAIGVENYYQNISNEFTSHRKGTIVEALVEAIFEHSQGDEDKFFEAFKPLAEIILASAKA